VSNAGAIKAGRAYVEIFTDNNPLVRGLKGAQGLIGGWGAGLRSLGTKVLAPLSLAGITGVAGLAALGSTIGEIGGQVDDMAQRTGLTAEAVSELGHAAQMSGTDLQTVEGGLTKMQRLLAEAAGGSKSARKELAGLGLSAEQLAGMSPDEQMAAFAESISSIADPAARTNAAIGVFGKSGQKLLPMLADGASGLAAMRQEARDLGISMSGEDAAAANELGDTIDKLKASLKAAAFNIGAAFAPALTAAATWLAKGAGQAARWVRDNRGLILAAIAGAAAIAGLGVALWGVGAVLGLISAGFGALVTLGGALGAALAFLVSPVGLVIAALIGVSVWLLRTTNIGQTALSWLGSAWGALAGDATTAWGAIVNAVKAGDLQSAFAVGMAFLRLQWVRATNFLESKWLDFRELFVETWAQAQGNVATLFVNTGATLETAWVQTLDFLFDAWTAFTTRFMSGWRTAQNFVGKGFAWLIAKMEGLDPNEVLAEMDADLARRNGAGQASADAAIAGRETARNQRLATIEATRRGAVGEIAADVDRQRQSRAGHRTAAQSREEQALAEAQAKFAAAAAAANKLQVERATKTKPGQPGFDGTLRGGAERAQKVADAADIRTGEGLKQVLSAFGGGGPQQQTAANTAKTNALLTATNQHLEEQTDTLDRIEREGGADTFSLGDVGG
jgi:hypothetical protein